MATFTALYKMRIFNFEDVMRDMLVGTLLLNYMELPTNLSTMPMLAAKAVSKILLLKE
uniref:hypothetical protein n=1 Tax=Prevotella sp. TaxID=59823 RepID=UPI0025CFA825